MKNKARERLEKRLAFGMALVNGANTIAPVGLLYTQPNQLLGQQMPATDLKGKPVAMRMSANADRKPYSCANLQSLAYAAMSAVDDTLFGKAEAFTSVVGAGGTTNYVSGETVSRGFLGWGGNTQDINNGGTAVSVFIGDSGTQNVNSGGTAIGVSVYETGAIQNVYGGGTDLKAVVYNSGTINVYGGVAQIEAIGYWGTLNVYSGASASVTHEGEGTILNSGGSVQASETIGGNMIVTDKGTLNVATVSNCTISASGSSKVSVGKQTGGQMSLEQGAVGTIDVAAEMRQDIGSGATGSIGSALYNAFQDIKNGGTGIIDLVSNNGYSYGKQYIEAGGYGWIKMLDGGRQTVMSGGTSIIDTMQGNSDQFLSGGGVVMVSHMIGGVQYVSGVYTSNIIGTMDGGTQIIDSKDRAGIATMNGGIQYAGTGGTGIVTNLLGGTQIPSDFFLYNLLRSGGTVIAENMLGGTQLVVKSGSGIVSNMSGGIQILQSQGKGTILTLNGGSQQIESGGSGSVENLSGGVQNIAVGGYGTVNYQYGGTQLVSGDSKVAVMQAGLQQIESNGHGDIAEMNGGTQQIKEGGHGVIVTLNNGEQRVGSNATAKLYNMNGGQQTLESGARSYIVNLNGGYQWVSRGAYASGTIFNGGYQFISAGGTGIEDSGNGGTQVVYAFGKGTIVRLSAGLQNITGGTGQITTMLGGTQLIHGDGYGTIAVMSDGVQEIIGHSGLIEEMDSGTQIISSGGTGTIGVQHDGIQEVRGKAVSTRVLGGTQILEAGGTLSKNVLLNGTQIIASGASLTADSAGAELTVQANVISNATQLIQSGGEATGFSLVNATQTVQGTANATTINQGGVQNLDGGDTAATTINEGGVQNVNSGSLAIFTMVNSGATQNINNAGIAMAAVVNSGGVQNLNSGATGFLGTVNGGTQNVATGAVSQLVAMEGGVLNIASNGNVAFGDIEAQTIATYTVDNVNSDQGIIQLGNISDKGYTAIGQTLNIDTLKGNATIYINVDSTLGKSDFVNITNKEGSTVNFLAVHYDTVLDSSGKVQQPQKDIIVAKTPTDVKLQAEATEYGPISITPKLTQDTTGNWHLNGYTEKPSTTTMTAGDTHRVIDQLWFDTVNSLSKRLGDLRLGAADADDGVWVRYQRKTTRTGRGSTSELNANMMQVGYDRSFKVKNGKSYVGIAVDHLVGGSVYDNGNGTAKGTSVALYNTWLGDKGHYYDFIIRRGHFSNDYKLTDLSKVESEGEYGVNATTLSGEYGYRKTLKNNLYIEPQAEIIYGHLNSTDYTTKYLWKNWNVHMDGVNHFVTRLGIAVGKSYGSGSYYAKTSYYHDFGGAGSLTYGVYPYSDVALRDWCEITLGGETKVAKNMVLYGEVTKYLGDVTNNLDFNAGLRWNF